MAWRPSVTVAAVAERNGSFLLVEEIADGKRVYNQPAGHWEPGETLAAGCARETLEESAHRFVPTHLIGIYRWKAPKDDVTFLRFAFCGEVEGQESGRALDREIVRAVWLTLEEIRELRPRHRSPLVLRCIEDYLSGRRFPLDLVAYCE